jgi:hypothetical protein
MSFADGLVREAELFGQLCGTKETQEAVQAFLDKRRPSRMGSGSDKTVARPL